MTFAFLTLGLFTYIAYLDNKKSKHYVLGEEWDFTSPVVHPK